MNLKRKKVLVTGACGFIGSHLVETLLKGDCQIRAFVFYNPFNSWSWLDSLEKNKLSKIEIFAGDIRNGDSVRKALKNIDIVFHLAALIGIPYSYCSPDSYIETNVKGTLNVLQACCDYNIERVIITSTSEVYGTAKYVPIDEGHPLQAQSPYSASKIGADVIAISFYKSFGLPVVIARPFNTYGPRQTARAVIPTIITQLLNSSKEIRLGSLYPIRDLSYVDDVCNAMVTLASCNEAIGKVINIGSGKDISIGELARLIIKQIKPRAKIVCEKIRKRPKESEVERLLCDNTLIKKMTNWEPNVSLEEGLCKTIRWFKNKENLSKYKYDIYNI